VAEEQGAVPDWRTTIGKEDIPDWRSTIGKTDVPDWRATIGKPSDNQTVQQRTTEMLQEEVAKWQKERENEIQKAGQNINEKADPSLARIGAGLAAEIAIGEGAKAGGTALGASLGVAGGPAAPGTVPAGAVIGYIAGGLSGGFTGNIAAQKIEGQPEISYGRATASALLNLIPGGIGKIAKGPKWIQRLTGVAARHPIATTAAVGAVAAPSSIAIERAIEGQAPASKEELLTYIGTGAALGAGLGKTAEYGKKLLTRFAGKNPAEIDLMVRRGDPDAVNYVDAFRGVNKNDLATVDDMKAYVNELGAIAKARIAPSTVLGRKATEEIMAAPNRITGTQQTGRILNKKVTDFIAKSEDKDLTDALIYNYLTGSAGPAPKEIAPIVDDLDLARTTIKKLQDELVQNHYNGQRVLPEETLKTIENSMNRGDYLTGEYQFFLNKNYQPTKQQTKDLMTRLQADGMSKADAEAYIANLNKSKAANADDLENFVASQNAGILKNRSDLSPELRDYLGEIADPGEMIEGTVSKLSRLVGYDTADFNIKNILRETGVAKVAGEGIEQGDFVPLNLRRGEAQLRTTGPNGSVVDEQLYVPKPVQEAIQSIYAKKADNSLMDKTARFIGDAFSAATALSKAAKVLGNPPSYLIQLYGNAATVFGQAMNPVRGIVRGGKYAAAQYDSIAKRMSSTNIAEMQRLSNLGLINDGVTVSDIREGLGGIGRVAQKVINPFGKAYSIPDTAMRILVFDNNSEILRRSIPGISSLKNGDEIIDKYAARLTHFTYPNYDYLNRGLRTLSKFGVLGQFASFGMELARTQFNQGRLIKSMINGSLAKELSQEVGSVNADALKKEGLKRMGAMIATYGATIGGIYGFNRLKSGYTSEQQQALKESVLPEWDEHKPLAFYKGKDGKAYYMNSSYLVPQAQLIAPFMAGLEGRNFKDAASRFAETLVEDLGGEGNFVLNALVPAIQNYNPKTKEPISKKVSAQDSRMDRLGWFADETFTPGIAREFERATSKTRLQPMQQTVLRQAGIRVNDTTIEDGARFRIKKVKDSLTALSKDYSYQRYKKQGQDLEPEYQRINEDYKANSAMLAKHAKNYRTLGFSEDKVLKLLRENGIGPAKALAAIDGEVTDLPKIPRRSITDEYESLPGTTEQEKMKAITEVSKADPFLAKSLATKLREEAKIKMLKIDERDKAVMSLGSDDGTRAAYIFKQMQKSQDPDGVCRNFLKKGLIDAQVQQQLQSLKNAK